MSKSVQFTLQFDEDIDAYVRKNYREFIDYRVVSKSLDARGAPKGRTPSFHYTVEGLVGTNDSYPKEKTLSDESWFEDRPIIIGAGPAGLFCALRLVDHGIKPILIERGEASTDRMLSISKFWRHGVFNPESNVCYGEGGAGLFSDGKLITRIKSEFISYVMKRLVDFGAPEEVSYISNPHLGSNKIRAIIALMSNYLKERGCSVIVNDKVDELLVDKNEVIGVKLKSGKSFFAKNIVLATGHSAHEMYAHLEKLGIEMKAKDFSVGVRIEHPRKYIDKIQHGCWFDSTVLGAARYRLSYHDHRTDHGVYSFCMCPGGYVLSSGTDAEGLVVNGMSNYSRNSPWSNSAIVVSVKAETDVEDKSIMGGLNFQRCIEQKAYNLSREHASGRELPAMTVGEFISGKLNSSPLPMTSSPSKVFKANIRELFPDFVNEHLVKGLKHFNINIPGFVTNDAVLIAPETRTSAPITIVRNKETFVSTSHKGLFPCGEGAGYAGGITSAAVDGVRVAESIINLARH
jgi:uncharacterized FAD-dependent dehydrogenase